MAEHNDLGKAGEELAVAELRKMGYDILHTNWRCFKDEVDIIAKENNMIIFAEVKTRQTNYFGEPEVFVTRKKQNFLIRAANHYAQKFDLYDEFRFDVVSVLYNSKQKEIKVIKDAFQPGM
jgi:putative endonuclease